MSLHPPATLEQLDGFFNQLLMDAQEAVAHSEGGRHSWIHGQDPVRARMGAVWLRGRVGIVAVLNSWG